MAARESFWIERLKIDFLVSVFQIKYLIFYPSTKSLILKEIDNLNEKYQCLMWWYQGELLNSLKLGSIFMPRQRLYHVDGWHFKHFTFPFKTFSDLVLMQYWLLVASKESHIDNNLNLYLLHTHADTYPRNWEKAVCGEVKTGRPSIFLFQ